jgi:hypothetical protein
MPTNRMATGRAAVFHRAMITRPTNTHAGIRLPRLVPSGSEG